jgi:hypothetical protein
MLSVKQMNTIQLNDEDARKFIEFQKRYELFDIMEKTGAFNLSYGKLIFNVANGVVQNIQKEEVVYHRK